MKAILLISFIISFSSVNAQPGKNNSNDQVEVAALKMPKFPIADFPKKSIPVSGIQIIQMLRDSIIVGYAMKGMDNHIVALVPEKQPTLFFNEAINKMYKSEFKEAGAQLLWVINDLRIGEKMGINQFSYLRFNADAYISKDMLEYKPVCSLDTVLMNESGGDQTVWHGEDIENAFRLLLKRTFKTCKDVLDQNIAGSSIEKIKEQSKPRIDLPILTNGAYREGAYADFEEFLQNSPSIINFRVFSIGREKKIKIVKVSQNNQTDTVNIWGFCKDGEIYKYNDGSLVSIERGRNGFIISNYVAQANRRNSGLGLSGFVGLGVMMGGMVGGAVSGLVFGLGTSKNYKGGDPGPPLLIKSIPYITKSKKQPEATCIDMKTGELSF